MSEQEQTKSSFMQELDHWTHREIVGAFYKATDAEVDVESPEWEKAVNYVKKAIREKVLESYRNGLKAGPRKALGRRS